MRVIFKGILAAIGLLLTDASYGEERTFTDARGRQIEPELVGLRGDNVVIRSNGRMAQWPIAKLSKKDQAYVAFWQQSAETTPGVDVRIWEREGIGEKGVIDEGKPDPSALGRNIPMIRQTEEKASYKHYDVDLHNRSAVDAKNLLVSYVLYVITPQNQVVGENGKDSVPLVGAESRHTLKTRGGTYVRTKTTSTTVSTNVLGNLSLGSDTSRSREKFGGAWVRVYSPEGNLIGEAKQLSDPLEKMNPAWTGDTVENLLPTPSSFEQLEKLLGVIREAIEKLPEPPPGLPKPPGGSSGRPPLPPGAPSF